MILFTLFQEVYFFILRGEFSHGYWLSKIEDVP